VLLEALPERARTQRRDSDRGQWWGYTEELLAQLIEVVSVLAADKRLTEPRIIPRPGSATDADSTSGAAPPSNTGFRTMLNAAKRKGAVRV
jgi:hypothetical protein